MKVIDLLNKIANKEDVPEKIKYKGNIYKFEHSVSHLYNYIDIENEGDYLEDDWYLTNILNDEIEIIEENKKDEEIELYVNGEKVDITDIYEPLKQGEFFYKENGKWYIHKLKNVSFAIEEDKKIEKILIDDFDAWTKEAKLWQLFYKLNEIIDKLNEINKNDGGI